MATLNVVGTIDFRGGPVEANIDRIVFGNAAIGIFGQNQFGPGLISSTVLIEGGDGAEKVQVQAVGSAALSAANWTFVNWTGDDAIHFASPVGLNNNFTGSSQKDLFNTSGGVDVLQGLGGDDTFQIGNQDYLAGSALSGGAGEDRLRVTGNVSLAAASVTTIERIEFVNPALTLTMPGAAFAPGGVEEVVGLGAAAATLVVRGSPVDLTGVSFTEWGGGAIRIEGTSATTNTLIGSSQRETIAGSGNSVDFIAGRGGADTLNGGGGSDAFRYFGTSDAQSGESVDGGAGSDSILLVNAGFIDFANVSIENVEALRFLSGRSGAAFRADQVRNGEIENVRGSAEADTLLISATGQFADLTGVVFADWTAGEDTVSISGSALQDVLLGSTQNDTINGLDLADVMSGGAGNDTYIVDVTGEFVSETAGNGIDLVVASATFVLASNQDIENLALTGTAAINATGNGLANTLTGNDSANRLSGLGGADTLIGGPGNDIYVNPAGDTIAELAGAGTDTVESSVAFSLEALVNIERLFLTGNAAINGTGNGLANQMIGNDSANTLSGRDGDDTINGGGGADTLNGGSGLDRLTGGLQRDKIAPGADNVADTLVYTALGESTGQTRDVITGMDFNSEDRIDLPGTVDVIAQAIPSGTLNNATFNADLSAAIGGTALPAGAAILFTATSGDLAQPGMVYLVVDANGIAGYQPNQDWVFQLENHTGALDTGDFI